MTDKPNNAPPNKNINEELGELGQPAISLDESRGIGSQIFTMGTAREYTLTTKSILSAFNQERRGSIINKTINDAAESAGVILSPPIEEADYYGKVTVRRANDLHREPLDTDEEVDNVTACSSTDSPFHSSVLSYLKPDAEPLDFLTIKDDPSAALEKMRIQQRRRMPLFFSENDMSTLIGTIEIDQLTLRDTQKHSHTSHLAQKQVPVVETHAKLLDWATSILEHGFIYGKDRDGNVVQIYTKHDLANHLLSVTQMFLRVHELEFLFQEILLGADSQALEDAKAVRSLKKLKNQEGECYFKDEDMKLGMSFEAGNADNGLTFADYVKCLADQKVWDEVFCPPDLGLKFDQDACVHAANQARLARNKVMHTAKPDAFQDFQPLFESAAVWLRKLHEYHTKKKKNHSHHLRD